MKPKKVFISDGGCELLENELSCNAYPKRHWIVNSNEYISIEHIKVEIERIKGKNIKGAFLIKVDELLKFIKE